MNDPADRPLLADLQAELRSLGGELREAAVLRWQLAQLELQSDLRSLKRLAVVWIVAAVLALGALPLAMGYLAELLDGCGNMTRGQWLLIFAAGLVLIALTSSWFAWRRFRRRFVGLRETLEELREDLLWLREKQSKSS